MKRISVFLIALTLSLSAAVAQERKPWLVRTVNKVGAFIDTLASRGVDKRYIYVPERPWQLVLKNHLNDMDMNVESTIGEEVLASYGYIGHYSMKSTFKPRFTYNIGLWVGYRGYGLGYNISLSKSNGNSFSIGATGSRYGIYLRTRSLDTKNLTVDLWGEDEYEKFNEHIDDFRALEDISINTFILDGYYMLNGKRFSYAAAYDQATVQLRSAGSLMIGAMWYQSNIDFSQRKNAPIIQAMGNTGKLKVQEGGIGVGYSYNWVPVKNLMVNVTAMPMLLFYNRKKLTLYESNYDIFLFEEENLKNGKKAYPDDIENLSWVDDVTLEETKEVVSHGKVSFNLDARASITYNWNRYFLNIHGQWNQFKHSMDNNTVKLNDWFVNASLGMRL